MPRGGGALNQGREQGGVARPPAGEGWWGGRFTASTAPTAGRRVHPGVHPGAEAPEGDAGGDVGRCNDHRRRPTVGNGGGKLGDALSVGQRGARLPPGGAQRNGTWRRSGDAWRSVERPGRMRRGRSEGSRPPDHPIQPPPHQLRPPLRTRIAKRVTSPATAPRRRARFFLPPPRPLPTSPPPPTLRKRTHRVLSGTDTAATRAAAKR